jgi:NAD(P)-dependent dehydrogenase (short-subunit alcohol dehydrogenase family)
MDVLVTGVSTGLGKAIFELNEPGVTVYGVSHADFDKGERRFLYDEIAQIPSCDVVILNAAIGDTGGDLSSFDEDEFQRIMDVNLMLPIQFLARLKKNHKLLKTKHVIFVGSRFSSQLYLNESNFDSLPGYGYCLSKSALSTFVQLFRKENIHFTVNILHPGVLATEMGATSGVNPTVSATNLFQGILNGEFDQNMEGIYDVLNNQLIPF